MEKYIFYYAILHFYSFYFISSFSININITLGIIQKNRINMYYYRKHQNQSFVIFAIMVFPFMSYNLYLIKRKLVTRKVHKLFST